MEPRTVELSGRVSELAMPAVCIHCGATAGQRFYVEKVFTHEHEDSVSHSIERVAVPFCPICLATHRSELRVVRPLARLRMMFQSNLMIGVVCQLAAALFFLTRGNMVTLIFGGCILALAAGCARISFNETRHLAVPPATSVSTAFGFGPDISGMFEPERRVYTLRNAQFGDAFIAVNRDMIWDPASPQAQRAATKRSFAIAIAVIVGIAIVAWGIYDEYFSD